MLPGFFMPAIVTSYDAAAQAYFDAMTVAPDTALRDAVNGLVVGLKADGLWAKTDFILFGATHNQQAGLLNLRNPAQTCTAFSGLAHTASRGFTVTGTGYILTPFNPATAGGAYTQNSAHLFSWVGASSTTTGGQQPTIGRVTAADAFLRPREAGGSLQGRVNVGTNITFGAVANRLGSRALSRTASNATEGYSGGSKVGSTDGTASTAVTSEALTLMRLTTSYNTTDTLAAASFGGGLTGTEVLAQHNRFNAALSALGAA